MFASINPNVSLTFTRYVGRDVTRYEVARLPTPDVPMSQRVATFAKVYAEDSPAEVSHYEVVGPDGYRCAHDDREAACNDVYRLVGIIISAALLGAWEHNR